MNYTQLELDLIRDEGIRLRTYRCTAGHLTIGVGHKITECDNLTDGDTISLERAGLLLAWDIMSAIGAANTIFRRGKFESMAEPRQRALLNMILNLGPNKFRGFKKMLMAIAMHDWAEASVQCLDSKYARQVGERAQRIAYALRNGSDRQ